MMVGVCVGVVVVVEVEGEGRGVEVGGGGGVAASIQKAPRRQDIKQGGERRAQYTFKASLTPPSPGRQQPTHHAMPSTSTRSMRTPLALSLASV
jgi:hypothetical protein